LISDASSSALNILQLASNIQRERISILFIL
jgi:hypothetical protein